MYYLSCCNNNPARLTMCIRLWLLFRLQKQNLDYWGGSKTYLHSLAKAYDLHLFISNLISFKMELH